LLLVGCGLRMNRCNQSTRLISLMPKIIFRVHKNTDEEIQIGHKVGFTIQSGVHAISVSANQNGFTPLTAVLRALYLNVKDFDDVIIRCRKENLVTELALPPSYPKLIIVPPTRGDTGKYQSYEYYAVRIIQFCNFNRSESLQFSHYGFMNGGFRANEIFRVLSVLINPLIFTTLKKIYFEVDARHADDFVNLYHYTARDCFCLNDKCEVIHAPEFEWKKTSDAGDGANWAELALREE
jgi:hypothetical protein